MANENLERLSRGWFPRPDAHWSWWIIADTVVLVAILKSAIRNKLRARRKV